MRIAGRFAKARKIKEVGMARALQMANLPRASDYTKDFLKDWQRLFHSGRYDEGGFAIIHGEPGTGKSVALRVLEDQLSRLPDITVGAILHPQSSLGDFYREMGDIQACRSVLFFQNKRQEISDDMVKQHWLSRTPDNPVFRAVQWMDAHLVEPYNLSRLAEIARVSERTLLRQFNSVLGQSPLQYLQQQRIERAKLMLEVTINTVQTVATACGYADVGSLRCLFLRLTEVTPAVYRKRFALRTQRSRWRVGDD